MWRHPTANIENWWMADPKQYVQKADKKGSALRLKANNIQGYIMRAGRCDGDIGCDVFTCRGSSFWKWEQWNSEGWLQVDGG